MREAGKLVRADGNSHYYPITQVDLIFCLVVVSPAVITTDGLIFLMLS